MSKARKKKRNRRSKRNRKKGPDDESPISGVYPTGHCIRDDELREFKNPISETDIEQACSLIWFHELDAHFPKL